MKILVFVSLSIISLLTIFGCSPSIELVSSWHDQTSTGKKFNKIIVLAIGKSLANRQIGEDKLVAELKAKGFSAVSGLTFLPPNFMELDSAQVGAAIKNAGGDAVVTVRAVSITESQRYVPGTTYAGGYGYPGSYGYWGGYYQSYGYYSSPGYTVTDVDVLLETNLYDLSNNKLLWIGQSKSITKDVTETLAAQYAYEIVNDLVNKKIITP